jgi:hypothetical protein
LNVHDDVFTNSEGIISVVNNVKGYRSIQVNSSVKQRIVGRSYSSAGARMVVQLKRRLNDTLLSVQPPRY